MLNIYGLWKPTAAELRDGARLPERRIFFGADDDEGFVMHPENIGGPATLLDAIDHKAYPGTVLVHWPAMIVGEASGVFYSEFFPVELMPESARYLPERSSPCGSCSTASCNVTSLAKHMHVFVSVTRNDCIAEDGRRRGPMFWIDVKVSGDSLLLREECRDDHGPERVLRVAVYERDTLSDALIADGRFSPVPCRSPYTRARMDPESTAEVAKFEPLTPTSVTVRRKLVHLEYEDQTLTVQMLPPENCRVVENKCAVCLANPTIMAFEPCGHMCCALCRECLRDDRCHMCRAPINKTIRLFY